MQLLQRRQQIVLAMEMVQSGVGNNQIELVLRKRQAPHVAAVGAQTWMTHRRPLHDDRGDIEPVALTPRKGQCQQTLSQSFAAGFIEKIGLQCFVNSRRRQPLMEQLSVQLVAVVTPEGKVRARGG